jgi:hypothetical protein
MAQLKSKQLTYPLSGSFTGSLYGTSSWAITASYAMNGGGGGGTPGGNLYEIQYNSGSTFGGVPVLTYDGITLVGTGSFSGSFTGLIDSASYAATASYAPDYLLLTETGSITVLSSSYAATASLATTASYSITASYSNTSTSASYALIATTATNADTASNILGGKATHVPYFITDTTLATSSIYQSGSTSVIINQDNNTTANPEALYVSQPHPTSINVISGKGNLNNYLQLNIQNTNNGISASSDIVATANNGIETEFYIDMGINGQNYGYYLGGPNDAYLYAHANNLWIGNVDNGHKVYFFNSSSLQPIITLNADNAEITGSLYGSSSYAITSSYSNTTTSASYSLRSTSASYASSSTSASYSVTASYSNRSTTASYAQVATFANSSTSASHAVQSDNAAIANFASTAGNGGVTRIINGSGITILPLDGKGDVTIVSSGGGGVTIISGSNVTQSFNNVSTWTFDHNQGTRTPIITTFDSSYNQIIPQNIELTNTSSATITFPEPVSGFAIASLGGTTGTVLSSSYSLFSTYATTASYYDETDPVFVAKSGSFATTGSNRFIGNQIITGSLIVSGSSTLTNIGVTSLTGSLNVTGSTTQTGNNTLIGNTTLSGSINISGSQTFYGTSAFYGNHVLSGSNTITGNTIMSGSIEVSGSSNFHNSEFIVTGSTYIKGVTAISGSTDITGSLNVIGNINVVSGSSFTRWGNKLFNYGQFANTSSITLTANVSGAFHFPLTYFNDGVSISNESRINFLNTGLYNIQFSALANQGNGTPNLHIWFKKTGSNIDNSDTLVQLQNNSQTLIAWNFAYPITAGEYVELWYHSSTSNTSFPTNPAESGFPSAPSIICTITQIA